MSKAEGKVKKEKKVKPAKEKYVEIGSLVGNGIDYHVYHMRTIDYIVSVLAGFAVAFLIIYIFFEAVLVALILGFACGFVVIKPYEKMLLEKRKKTLLLQFKDLLESLSGSYSAGRNTAGAFADALNDMQILFGENSYICQELRIINAGLNNNINIEDLLMNLSDRTGLEDIASFAEIFRTGNRLGSNIKDIVSQTREIINDKMEVEMEIETMVTGPRTELYIMTVMPIIVVFSLKLLGQESLSATNVTNIIIRVVVLGIMVFAFLIGKKFTDIKA